MAITALYSGATGLSALSTELDVISNNLANVNTKGFKASRVNFEDLVYQEKAQPGVENANGDERPMGLFVGLGTRVSNTQFDFTQGDPISTNSQLDMCIAGRGFFQVQLANGAGDGTGYSRAGNFTLNSNGEMVLGTANGPRLEPPIQIPQEATAIDITSDGQVWVQLPNQVDPQQIGQIELAQFINPEGLKPIGGNVYIPSGSSGPAITGVPDESNFGSILQQHLEASNVNPVTELTELIRTQRAFEMNSKSIQAADQSLQVISNLQRF